MTIRLAQDSDRYELIGLVAQAWADYPGCVLDVHGEMPHLLRIASWAAEAGGVVWVACDASARPVGMVGMFLNAQVAELKLLYVSPLTQRQGLGQRLVHHAEAWARERGSTSVALWSDTRFTVAHRLYERLGYTREPQTRSLHDLSHSVEYFFSKNFSEAA